MELQQMSNDHKDIDNLVSTGEGSTGASNVEEQQILPVMNRVESLFTKTPSHTTVQALSHTAVLALYFTNSQRRENKPIPLNQFKFSAL